MSIVDEIVDAVEDIVCPMRTHRVEFNENLATISRYYYGTPNHATDIYQANRSQIMNINDVSPGMILVIPHLTHRHHG